MTAQTWHRWIDRALWAVFVALALFLLMAGQR